MTNKQQNITLRKEKYQTLTINNIKYAVVTIDKFFTDTRKKESEYVDKADSASYNTIIACLASVLKESYTRAVLMDDKQIRKFLINKVYCIDTTDSQKSDVYNKAKIVCYLYKQADSAVAQVIETTTRLSDIDIITDAIKMADKFHSQREALSFLNPKKEPKAKADKQKESSEEDSTVTTVKADSDCTPEEIADALFNQLTMFLNKMDDAHRNAKIDEYLEKLASKKASQKAA